MTSAPAYRTVDRHEVQRLMAAGAQVVEALAADEYDRAHLPGAVHIPAEELGRRAPVELRADQAVVVYCYDSL